MTTFEARLEALEGEVERQRDEVRRVMARLKKAEASKARLYRREDLRAVRVARALRKLRVSRSRRLCPRTAPP